MSEPIRKPDENPSRVESILSDTIGLSGYEIEAPRSRIEILLLELEELIKEGGGESSNYGTSLSIEMHSNFVMSASLLNKDGEVLGEVQTVDLPLESVVVDGSYDSINKQVVLTLQNGSIIHFSVADLVDGLQTEITSQNPLDADLISDSNSTHKFTTASDISKLAGIEAQANKTIVDSSITDGGTNPVTGGSIYTALAGKLGTDTHYAGSSATGGSATSAVKLDNSTDAGSSTNPVYFSNGVPVPTTYSLSKSVPADAEFTDTTYESKTASDGGTDVSLCTTGEKYAWNNKQNTLSSTQLDAVNSGIDGEKVAQIEINKNNISFAVEKIGNNLVNVPSGSGVRWVDVTVNIPPGVYTFGFSNLSGDTIGQSQVSFYSADSSFYTYIGKGNDVYINNVTFTNTVTTIRIYASTNNTTSVNQNVSFTTLFLCKQETWNSSVGIQPYAMSNAELTAKEQQNENNILSLQNSRGVLSDATTIIDTDWTLTTIELIAPVNSIVNMTAALVYGAKAPRGIRITRSNTSPTTGVIANIEVSDDAPQIITQGIGVKLNGINTYYVWAKAKAATTNVPAYLIYEIY